MHQSVRDILNISCMVFVIQILTLILDGDMFYERYSMDVCVNYHTIGGTGLSIGRRRYKDINPSIRNVSYNCEETHVVERLDINVFSDTFKTNSSETISVYFYRKADYIMYLYFLIVSFILASVCVLLEKLILKIVDRNRKGLNE